MAKFTPANTDSFQMGVLDEENNPITKTHHFYVDDGIWLEVFDTEKIEKAIAAYIEAICILLGEPIWMNGRAPSPLKR